MLVFSSLWCPRFVVGSPVCTIRWGPLQPLHQNLQFQLWMCPNRKPSQSNCVGHVLKTPSIWDLGKDWKGTSSGGRLEGLLVSTSPPWCLFMGARYNWSWQLKQSCHSLKEGEDEVVYEEGNFSYCDALCGQRLIEPVHTVILFEWAMDGTEHHSFFFSLITSVFLHN